MALSPLSADDPVQLGSYRLLGRIAKGGMGAVYLASDQSGRSVTIKVGGHLRDEVALSRQVPSFCIPQVLDSDLDHEPQYVVTEYVDGPSLADIVERAGPPQAEAVERLAAGVAEALAAIHEAGVVHRDIKPSNVIFGGGTPKLIDFGIARPIGATPAEPSGEFVGTISYTAPEVLVDRAQSPAAPAADVFAWGALVAYAATGRNPFAAESLADTVQRVLTETPDLEGLPEDLRGLVSAALSKDPQNRPSARDLARRLESRSEAREAPADAEVDRPQPATPLDAEIALLSEQLSRAEATRELDEPSRTTANRVRAHLEAAQTAMRRPRRLPAGRRSDTAAVELHAAKILLVDVLPDAEVDAMIPSAFHRLNAVLRAGDPRRSQFAWLLRGPRPEVRRAALRDVLEAEFTETARRQSRIRSFRNALLLTAGLLLGPAAAVVVASTWRPELLSLCFPVTPGAALACPSGSGTEPFRSDVLLVTLIGATGGAVSSVSAIRSLRGTATPYILAPALCLLKLPASAVTAVLGLMLLRGDFIPGLAPPETPSQILAYAVMFGLAQQLFTRYLDRQGAALLAEAPEAPDELLAGDIRSALNESVQTSIDNAFNRPVVTNVEGALHLSSHADSGHQLELSVRLTTGPGRWRSAAEDGIGKPFRLTGGKDALTAPFEIVIDAAGMRVEPARASLDLVTDGGEYLWTSVVSGDRNPGTPIWVTLYSSGRYVQAARLIPDVELRADVQR